MIWTRTGSLPTKPYGPEPTVDSAEDKYAPQEWGASEGVGTPTGIEDRQTAIAIAPRTDTAA